ncbi:TPA: hypothetical protein HA265_07725 [Candidatus Woesearchaeota archaeon]|nr:hypothetical protein [Candidatus Woesearchaeota archaeon]
MDIVEIIGLIGIMDIIDAMDIMGGFWERYISINISWHKDTEVTSSS